ncbi:MAG: lipoyl synthase [Pseudomonadales bacterium]
MDKHNPAAPEQTPAPRSGEKFVNASGITAIKDGVKHNANQQLPTGKKPPWLRVKIGGGAAFKKVQATVHEHKLATVCEESHCPNIGECWAHGTATIMLMGSVCTRACKFCAVDTGNPGGRLDPQEPANAAESVRLMGLQYVVLTSVDRDDLPDGGAHHYAACVRAIKQVNPQTRVEALTPDFNGDAAAIEVVVNSGLEVFAQNVETVSRLTHVVRDPRAGYQQTLNVLKTAKQIARGVLTKTSLMLGIGERDDEVVQCMRDLREHDVDILTLGQYLRPTKNHLPLDRWVTPEQFAEFREIGLQLGFMEVASGPLVRSSYRADRIFAGNNLGLNTIPVKSLS